MTQASEFRRELEHRKQQSVLQLLFKSARLTNELAIERARSGSKVANLRTAHTTLLPHIDLEGTRLTELARRMGISKQAVAQLVEELEGFGMLERVPDPSDGRARLVRFTAQGRRGLLQGLRLLAQLEAELAEVVGERRLRALRSTLSLLVEHLESRS